MSSIVLVDEHPSASATDTGGATPHPIQSGLAKSIEAWTRLNVHSLMERFVLRNGRPGHPSALPKGVRRGAPKECFRNAAQIIVGKPPGPLRKLDLTYVEGYAARPSLGMLVHHAWVETAQGEVIDTTWEKPHEALYWGVPVPADTLGGEMLRNKVYGVLDLGPRLNHEFMFAYDPGLKPIIDGFVQQAVANGPVQTWRM